MTRRRLITKFQHHILKKRYMVVLDNEWGRYKCYWSDMKNGEYDYFSITKQSMISNDLKEYIGKVRYYV